MTEIKPELREFIYLNEISINSHLSSLGQGIPEEIIQESGDESTKSGTGEGGVTIPGTSMGIQGSGKISHTGRSNVSTKMKISAPYRFEELLQYISEYDFPMHEDPDKNILSRGDIVKISGITEPMSLFKIEIAIKLFLEIMEEETRESMERLPNEEHENELQSEQLQQVKDTNKVLESFLGKKIPLRIQQENTSFGFALNRDFMRANPFRKFSEKNEYILIGRVEKVLENSEIWDPMDLSSIIGKYMGRDEADKILEDFGQTLNQIQLNISFNDQDKYIAHPGVAVFPIALYW